MKIEDLKKRIRAIELAAKAGEDDLAHEKEDELYRDVLLAISEGCDEARKIATLAIGTSIINFKRYCI